MSLGRCLCRHISLLLRPQRFVKRQGTWPDPRGRLIGVDLGTCRIQHLAKIQKRAQKRVQLANVTM